MNKENRRKLRKFKRKHFPPKYIISFDTSGSISNERISEFERLLKVILNPSKLEKALE